MIIIIRGIVMFLLFELRGLRLLQEARINMKKRKKKESLAGLKPSPSWAARQLLFWSFKENVFFPFLRRAEI